jgi:hypothetical protein
MFPPPWNMAKRNRACLPTADVDAVMSVAPSGQDALDAIAF